MRHNVVSFINSSGLNYNTRYKALIEAILNLIISLILVKPLGIIGVVLGTIISFVIVSVWYEPFILYKNWFEEGLIKYYLQYIVFFILTISSMLLFNYIISFISCTNYLHLILQGVLGLAFTSIIIIIFFSRTSEFKYYINILKNLFKKIKGKVRHKNT